ncbi:hypothetical protein MLD38_040004 [Melastoma candidum]|uniref:Uncharacterized protein n=1 Tax=Melastoma candidum TaxID=119954 RepID=A0ACB9L546_9MYRT|nr:hypothetical protein MLD38_040004 [Melastoma candidum]
MDYMPVYRLLKELFPQIDDRLLKVTAKEHPQDADAAVEYIVTEFLPRMVEKAKASSSNDPSRNLSSFAPPDAEAELEDQSSLSRRRKGGHRLAEVIIKETPDSSTLGSDFVKTGSSMVIKEVPFYDAIDGLNEPSKGLDVEVNMDTEFQNDLKICKENQTVELNEFSSSHPCDANGNCQLCGSAESEELILIRMNKVMETNGSYLSSSNIVPVSSAVNYLSGLQSPRTVDSDATAQLKSSYEEPCSDGSDAEAIHQTTPLVSLATPELPFQASVNSQELEKNASTLNNCVAEDMESPLDRTANTGIEDVEAAEVTSTCANRRCSNSHEEDESPLEMLLTHSEQICSVDLLEQIIDDAKNNKKTLFSAVELVITMIKEVEAHERAVELAKKEAEIGGVDLLAKVAELEKMLAHAKEANDMHTGEVYGEKAVLVTEVRELQSRLRSLSDEWDNALAILDEMSKTMECRIAEATEMRIEAEEEKLNKEAAARAALNEQEAMMEKVVQQSKILQEAAEENSKLRDFLMDRGRVVDMLQGETSVICQDVRILKEKFDARVPLSQSISSSQTSCLLASSSGSSHRSPSNSLNLNDGEAEVSGNGTVPLSFVGELQKVSFEEERGGRDDRELDDMGWEFFDKDTEMSGLAGDGTQRLG